MNEREKELVKIQVYREGYKALTGKEWKGSIEDLYKTVDALELGNHRIDFKE